MAGLSSFEDILELLRWKADMCVQSPEHGKFIFLKPLYINGEQVGLTECCLKTEPCERHVEVEE